jgi:hypothetical protein
MTGGFPGKSDPYNNLLHNIEGGPILRELKHLPPPLYEGDPKFYSAYDEYKHGEQLKRDLDHSHLDPHVQEKIDGLVKKYWSVFNKKGIFVPVQNYECVIDTGNAPPIAVRKILYGFKETPIMRGCIAALEKVGHIQQIHDSRWLFKALLAAKTTSRACTRHRQILMEVLRKLHTPQLCHKNNLPNPSHGVTWHLIKSLGWASFIGSLMPQWSITNLP